MRIGKICLIGVLAGLSQPVLAQTPVVLQNVPAVEEEKIFRQITLDELGYRRGVTFTSFFGREDLYFPVPEREGLLSAQLILNYSSGSTVDDERYVRIWADDRIVKAINLAQLPSMGQIEIPVDVSQSAGGFVRITLEYSGGSSELMCLDERVSGDFLAFREDSMLVLGLNPNDLNTADTIARLQPTTTRVTIPEGPLSPTVLTAALKAASLYDAESGQVAFGGASANTGFDWTEAQISITASDTATGFASLLEADKREGWPLLTISGADAQQAFDLLNEKTLAGLSTVEALSSDGFTAFETNETAVGFDQLGFDLGMQSSSGTSTFDFAFDIDQLPQGMRPGSVSLLVAAAQSSSEDAGEATVVAFLNGTILGSAGVPDSSPTWMEFDIPKGLEARDNIMRVQVLRRHTGDACELAPQSFPAQVLPGSAINLLSQSGEVLDFYTLRQNMQGNVDIMVESTLQQTAPAAFLNRITPALASVIPASADLIPVTSLSETSTVPFIYVSDRPPLGSDPRLRFDAGVVELRNGRDEVIFNGGELDQFAMAQIVTIGTRSGLWLRLGQGEAPVLSKARPLVLDRGDVALMDQSGIVLATSTAHGSLVRIEYPERQHLWKTVERYRPWIIVGIWLVVTLLVLRILRSIYASKQVGSD
ncbi:cellulose biosynthesis cyclic di-GMP-binding regulatory protein BcsB [Rhodobacteraceae bacterium]|nr:cellulose biosynthesis cyclic di-GMP-binding regulatory protein BcsB [Paracoccaceae bacterium]